MSKLNNGIGVNESGVVNVKSGNTINCSSDKLQVARVEIPIHNTLQEAKSIYVKAVLKENKGNKTRTAKHLSVGIRTLQRWIKDYQIKEET